MQVIVDNLDVFGRGIWGTVTLFFWATLGSLVLGTVLAVFRISPSAALRAFGTTYVNVFRNTPLTLIMVFCVLCLPTLQITFSDDTARQYRAYAILALVAYTSCFVCEAVRSGINTVPLGQAEAARAIGLPFTGVLRLVVLPQAFRAVVPPLGSVLNALLKNTSVASAASNYELVSAMRNLVEQNGNAVIAVLIGITVAYMLLAGVLFTGVTLLERRTARSGANA
ncbi:amino acid ABC transporter permease [Kineococcus radiotolerans]|uniref:Polar amino acid ABC transporter, inner membrane subunit n=1 Tax=Kineococcus radiotolerans (strain ATCC BAA-149 / DSM 14245 / SRS30216) TaxID=266940 RepID=A6W845_KINRD|nr:amino acid ABC transporter permease [Kineococcus radiotolerans]ABS02984.1 polar amino acid ABC transporter, inner membrane subunit [Kineococcus radiotolerans SRS30216 = ATCC BAA-149]